MAKHLVDFLAIFGLIFTAYGAWLIYKPAGYLVLGVLLLTAAYLAAKANAARSAQQGDN